jgi:hypothetical protein
MMKTKQLISVAMIVLALGGVLTLWTTDAQAQSTLPESCLARLDFYYACQNSDWRPDNSLDKGVATTETAVTLAEFVSLYTGHPVSWIPDVTDLCTSRMDYFYACRNGWQPGR